MLLSYNMPCHLTAVLWRRACILAFTTAGTGLALGWHSGGEPDSRRMDQQ